MAPSRARSLAPLVPLFLLLLLLSLLLPTQTSAARPPPPPIDITLFMETLCPYCANATVNQVKPLMKHPVLGDAIRLTFVPFGNARADANATTTPVCQHGPDECALNTLLSCAIALYPSTWFDFAVCLEEIVLAASEGKASAADLSVASVAARCAPASTARLVSCAEGPLGRALTRMAGERTAALVPKHQYVPWFVVNGVPLKSTADNLLAFVCVALDPARRRLAAADVCADPVVDSDDEKGIVAVV